MSCRCVSWIQALDVPGKIIVLKCSLCGTEYTLYPDGTIAYESCSIL